MASSHLLSFRTSSTATHGYSHRFPAAEPKPSFVNTIQQIDNKMKNKFCASVNDVVVPVVMDPAPATEITWQIVVGALAGVTPFVVAGIEFSKRIITQKRCQVCNGSGLVFDDVKDYIRCPQCGGFLPWQSWKRFFSG